ncbi:glycosyltransferase family 4 protein, partial [Salmonella enterica]|nr:glycosyltransferase family 4 protein [Salmonella enterica]
GSVYPVMPVYRQADLVVMPSRKETFGMVVVEASSLGVPVFASQVGGLPDIIRHQESGILLPVDNPDEWRAAMCDFLDNPDCYRRLAVRARVDVEARFTIHRVVADIVALGKGLSG